MSEPVAKRQPIDLDEFDRRLRGSSAPQPADEDPLAELARLVSAAPDPFAPLFSQGRPGPRPPQPPLGSRQAPPPRLLAQPQLRPSFAPEPQDSAPENDPQALDEASDDDQFAQDPRSQSLAFGAGQGQAPRSGRRVLLMTCALAVVLAGIGGTLALRGHVGHFGSPPTILADSKPYKVKADDQAPKDPSETATSMLDKKPGDSVRPANIVNTEEQPVDLSTVAPSSGPEGAAQDPGSPFPPPKRVKTVSVRPDGSIISQDDPNASAESSAAPSPVPAGPPAADGEPAAPAIASSSAAPSPSPDSSAPTSFANVVDQAAANPAPAADSADAPQPPSRPTGRRQIADISQDKPAQSSAANPVAGSGWAVQLAAPGSAREAHTAIGRLEKKFSSQLGGKTLVAIEAQSNGRTVWRVRAAGLSKDGAGSLCGQIKSGGGACFIARD